MGQRQVRSKEATSKPGSASAKPQSATPEREEITVSLKTKITEKLVYWIIFSVLVALVPFLADITFRYLAKQPISFALVFSHGQLLILSAAICASGLGELLKSKGKNSNLAKTVFKAVAGGGCIIIIFFTSALFGQIGTGTIADPQQVWQISRLVMIGALIATGCCMVISEMD